MTVDNARLKIKKKFDFTPRAIFVTPSGCLLEWLGIVGKRRKMAIMRENHTLSYFLVSQYLPITIFGNWNFKPFFIHSTLFQRSLRIKRSLGVNSLRKLRITAILADFWLDFGDFWEKVLFAIFDQISGENSRFWRSCVV